ncbi:MAG: replication protein RepA [Candidatus Aenigmarchaeota archaeon]|nr:replication protein RepA [Candidatus Aenigmarchaeota archaeon]
MPEEENSTGPQVQEFQRRVPFVDRKVSEIKPEDIRIRIMGTIVDKKGNVVVIDDGSGKINANFEEPVKLEANTLVRAFGRVVPIEAGFELQGEIIQNMAELDMELFKKVKELGG